MEENKGMNMHLTDVTDVVVHKPRKSLNVGKQLQDIEITSTDVWGNPNKLILTLFLKE